MGTETLIDPLPVLDLAVATDLTEGAKLRDCRRISHTLLEARFDGNMSKEQWVEYGKALKLFRTALPYYRADWMRFGTRYGKDFVQATVDQLELSLEDVNEAASIALVDAKLRSIELEPAHYEVLGFLIDTDKLKQEDVSSWLIRATEEKLTPGELHNSVIEGHVVKRAVPASGHKNRDGFLTIQGIGTTFTRWLRNVEKGGAPVEKMAREQKMEIMTEIAPIAELHARLKAEVSA